MKVLCWRCKHLPQINDHKKLEFHTNVYSVTNRLSIFDWVQQLTRPHKYVATWSKPQQAIKTIETFCRYHAWQVPAINGDPIQLAIKYGRRNIAPITTLEELFWLNIKISDASVSMLTKASCLTPCVLRIKYIVLYTVLTLVDCINRLRD